MLSIHCLYCHSSARTHSLEMFSDKCAASELKMQRNDISECAVELWNLENTANWDCRLCHRNAWRAPMQPNICSGHLCSPSQNPPPAHGHTFVWGFLCTHSTVFLYFTFSILYFAFLSFCVWLCLHGQIFARGVPVYTIWSNLPSHSLAID